MRLLTPPWKTAWYDDQLSDRFFKEMSKTENSTVKDLHTTAQWMEQMMIEFGQLAQNMIHLEEDRPSPAQIRMAFEKSLKLSVLAGHLAASLDRSDPEQQHTPVRKQQAGTVRAAMGSAPREQPEEAVAATGNTPQAGTGSPGMPPKQTILSLSGRGLSVPEIEVITGHPRTAIETILSSRR